MLDVGQSGQVDCTGLHRCGSSFRLFERRGEESTPLDVEGQDGVDVSTYYGAETSMEKISGWESKIHNTKPQRVESNALRRFIILASKRCLFPIC